MKRRHPTRKTATLVIPFLAVALLVPGCDTMDPLCEQTGTCPPAPSSVAVRVEAPTINLLGCKLQLGLSNPQPADSGNAELLLDPSAPALIQLLSPSGNPILLVVRPADSSRGLESAVTVTPMSTAVSLLYILPMVAQSDPEEQRRMLSLIEQLPEIAALAEAISQVLQRNRSDVNIDITDDESVKASFAAAVTALFAELGTVTDPTLARAKGLLGCGAEPGDVSFMRVEQQTADRFILVNRGRRWVNAYLQSTGESWLVPSVGSIFSLRFSLDHDWISVCEPETLEFRSSAASNGTDQLKVYGPGWVANCCADPDENERGLDAAIATFVMDFAMPTISVVTNLPISFLKDSQVAKCAVAQVRGSRDLFDTSIQALQKLDNRDLLSVVHFGIDFSVNFALKLAQSGANGECILGPAVFRDWVAKQGSVGIALAVLQLAAKVTTGFDLGAAGGTYLASQKRTIFALGQNQRPNTPPVAYDQSVIVANNTPQAITLTASDRDGDALTYAIIAYPSHGVLTGTPPSVLYTPYGAYAGSDSFEFTVDDGLVDSPAATVFITVSATTQGRATVVSFDITDVTSMSATCGGNVTSDGGATVTARGVCWNTTGSPTIADSHTNDGAGTGNFTSSITGLSPSTTYYVRAYGINTNGAAYSSQSAFATSVAAIAAPAFNPPDGSEFPFTLDVLLSLSTYGGTIYYTLDGTEPTADAALYAFGEYIHLTRTTTIRARAYKQGTMSGPVSAATYVRREPPGDDTWRALNRGLRGVVSALHEFDGDLFAAGTLDGSGTTSTPYIARWDGTDWLDVGGGANSWIKALTSDGARLIAGGAFTEVGGNIASRIAAWDGSAWHALGAGLDGPVDALEVFNGEVFAGGRFEASGGTTLNHIGRWNGENWLPLGEGLDGWVTSLLSANGELIVAGDFSHAGGAPAEGVAKWNGNGWTALDAGLGRFDYVASLAYWSGGLYAAGRFLGDDASYVLASWNGSNWQPYGVGDSVSESASVCAPFGSTLVVGGNFTMIDGISVNRVAAWDRARWRPVGDGFDAAVVSLQEFDGSLFAGGYFVSSGDSTLEHVARWAPSDSSPSARPVVNIAAISNVAATSASCGGDVTSDGGAAVTARGVCWNTTGDPTTSDQHTSDGTGVGSFASSMTGLSPDTPYYVRAFATNSEGTGYSTQSTFTTLTTPGGNYAWQALGTGMNDSVYALTVYDGDLVAGGQFTTADGVTCNRIARWNGSSWQALGTGMNDKVYALTVYDEDLIAGGQFTTADGVTCNRIARWNGSSWQPLGTGMSNNVLAFTVYNEALIAAGQFTTAGGVACNRIARWNGSTWEPVGTGTNNRVNALAVYGGELIAGGQFNFGASDEFAWGIARWDGTSWYRLGAGLGGNLYRFAYALLPTEDGLFVGGVFDSAGGSPANSLAIWNNVSWAAAGQGLGPEVDALVDFDSGVVAGGLIYANGSSQTGVYNWNGSSWIRLGGTLSVYLDDYPRVSALTAYNGTLIAGGRFNRYDAPATGDYDTVINYIGRWVPVP